MCRSGRAATGNCAAVFEPLDRIEEMAHRSGQAIETHYNQDVAGLDFPHEAGELRASARRAGACFAKNHVATGGREFVGLRLRRLVLGRNPRVARAAIGLCGARDVFLAAGRRIS